MKLADFNQDIIDNGTATGKPVAGFFELTSRCNLRCKMCYVCGTDNHQPLLHEELTAAQWIELGKQACDAGLLFLTLTGGEIFIRKDFWQIYEALTNMGLIITLFTNGTLLNDDMIQRLTKLPPLKISITMYGANAETYGKVTGHPEAYEKTVTAVKKLVEAGIMVQLKTTVIKQNSGEFNEMAKFARSLGLNFGLVNYISPRREGTGTDPMANRLDPDELACYEANANDCMRLLYEQYKDKYTDISEDVMIDKDVENVRKSMNLSVTDKSAFRCTAGKCSFWLTWEGKMLPCGAFDDIQSDTMFTSFEGAWKEIKEKCAKVPVCQECESCSNATKCIACPARLKLETGSYEKPAPYLCDCVKARDALKATR